MRWILRPDALYIWSNKEVKERLSWYYSVMRGLKPAKFIIASSIPVEELFEDLNLEELWKLHEEKQREFHEVYNKIREGENFRVKRTSPNFLDLKHKIALKILQACNFCEWRCKVNRADDKPGVCRLGYKSYISTYFLHWGEEAPLIPSGTIFFSSCNFRCAFCQNWDISTRKDAGFESLAREIAGAIISLKRDGAININFVGGEPTPNLHNILGAIRYVKESIPLLWNSNMYCSFEIMNLLRDVIDIWLPDFKYGNDKCARRLSRIPNYFYIVSRNHKLLDNWGEDVIIRHLVMPNHIECCTKPVLKWIADNMSKALVNVMAQYRPEHLVARYPDKYPDISKRPSSEEMREAYRYASEVGLVYEPVS